MTPQPNEPMVLAMLIGGIMSLIVIFWNTVEFIVNKESYTIQKNAPKIYLFYLMISLFILLTMQILVPIFRLADYEIHQGDALCLAMGIFKPFGLLAYNLCLLRFQLWMLFYTRRKVLSHGQASLENGSPALVENGGGDSKQQRSLCKKCLNDYTENLHLQLCSFFFVSAIPCLVNLLFGSINNVQPLKSYNCYIDDEDSITGIVVILIIQVFPFFLILLLEFFTIAYTIYYREKIEDISLIYRYMIWVFVDILSWSLLIVTRISDYFQLHEVLNSQIPNYAYVFENFSGFLIFALFMLLLFKRERDPGQASPELDLKQELLSENSSKPQLEEESDHDSQNSSINNKNQLKSLILLAD